MQNSATDASAKGLAKVAYQRRNRIGWTQPASERFHHPPEISTADEAGYCLNESIIVASPQTNSDSAYHRTASMNETHLAAYYAV